MSTIKIARFEATDEYKLICFFTFVPSSGYIQTSEWVEVEFPPIANAKLLKQQLRETEEIQKQAFEKYNRAAKAFQAAKAAVQATEGEPA